MRPSRRPPSTRDVPVACRATPPTTARSDRDRQPRPAPASRVPFRPGSALPARPHNDAGAVHVDARTASCELSSH